MAEVKRVSAESLSQAVKAGGIVLDVRTPMEHNEKHVKIKHAHVPLDQLNPAEFAAKHGLDQSAEIYVLCRSGKRAEQAVHKFQDAGYSNVHVIEGGIIACEGCGQELGGYGSSAEVVVGDKKPLSLERQVRIAAGLFVAIGAVLAVALSSLFILIPLFVGCGLVFAGVTDRCGLALVLTKAPWNKSASSGSACVLPSGSCATSSSDKGCQ